MNSRTAGAKCVLIRRCVGVDVDTDVVVEDEDEGRNEEGGIESRSSAMASNIFVS